MIGFALRWLFVRVLMGPTCRTPRCGRLAVQDGLCYSCLGEETLERVVRG